MPFIAADSAPMGVRASLHPVRLLLGRDITTNAVVGPLAALAQIVGSNSLGWLCVEAGTTTSREAFAEELKMQLETVPERKFSIAWAIHA